MFEASRAERPLQIARAQDSLRGFDCEILISAAHPDVVSTDNPGNISASVILEGANIPVTDQAEVQLAERGVLCIPDVIACATGSEGARAAET